MTQSMLLQDTVWRQLLEKSAVDTRAFASTFLGDIFFRPFSKQSKLVFEAIDSPAQQVLIVAHRGFGKTSGAKAALLKRICYREARFALAVSSTASFAEQLAGNLMAEIQGNALIQNVFGSLKDGENWSKQHFKAGDTFVLPRGAGQQVRGQNYMNRRPDFILVDDLEDPEGVASPDRRLKLKQWFFADLLNSVDRGSKNWKVIVIGTLLHEDSLIANLMDDPAWHIVNIPLCDDDLISCYPDFMDDSGVRALYDKFLAQGQADVFAREYQNKPISGLDAIFKSDYWKDKYYEPAEILSNKDIYYVTIVDPAKTVKLSADYSAVVTIGIDLDKHRLYFHDCVSEHFHPDELYDEMLRQVQVHGSRILAVEVTSLHEFITQPILNELRKRQIHVQFEELKARDKKERRIAQLAPYYRQGYVYHNKNVSAKLEGQLMSFPRSKYDDVSDAFAYVIELLELNEDYFYAPIEPDKDEYASLENESYESEWRTA